MPTIGWFEILIVVAIAIVVLGPKDFPVMLKKAGSWIGTAKRYVSNIQNEVSNIDIEDEKINEIKKEIEKFSRQIILKNIGAAGQKKILSSKVLIVGMGG